MKQNDKCSIQYALYKRYQFDEDKTRELCKECKSVHQTYFTTINAAYVGLQQTLRESFGTTLSYGIFDVYVEQKFLVLSAYFKFVNIYIITHFYYRWNGRIIWADRWY